MQCSLAGRLAPFFASELRNARPFWCPLFVWFNWFSSSAPILLVRLSVSFLMSSPGYSFNTLDYSVDSLLVLSWRWLSDTRILHERSLLPKFCGLSAVRMMWCDAKTRWAAPHYLPRQKALTNHQNSLEYTQEHIPWLLKCLHYNIKLLYGQKKHYSGRKACVAMVITGVSKIRPKRNILHLFHRPTNGFLLFSAKWTSLWNQTFLPSERNERSEFLNWPTDYLFHATFSTLEHSAVHCQTSSQLHHSSVRNACGHPVKPHCGPNQLTGWVGALNRESATDLLWNCFHVPLWLTLSCEPTCWQQLKKSVLKVAWNGLYGPGRWLTRRGPGLRFFTGKQCTDALF